MLRTLIWKLFPPYEVEAARSEIQSFLDLHDGIARREIEEILSACMSRDPKMVVDAIRLQHRTANHVALALLVGVLRARLSTGQYHVYRGLLNMTGEYMHGVWRHAVSAMVDAGHLEGLAAEELRKSLADEIRSVG